MKKICATVILCSLSFVVNAQFSQSQVKELSKKVVEEMLLSSRLNDDYSQHLRKYLERIMFNEQIISLWVKILKEQSFSSVADAEKVGFNVMTGLREKSILTLSNEELYKLLKINLYLISRMTDYECSQYIKKKRTDENGIGRHIFEITSELDLNSFKEYISYYDKAFSNMLLNKSHGTRMSEKETNEVRVEFQNLVRELIQKNKFVSDYFKSGKSFSESSNTDVCRIGKELLNVVISGDSEKAKKRASAYINNQLN